MHQTLEKLYNVQFGFQSNLFPHIKEELGHLTKFQQKFIQALEISQLDTFIFRILAKENIAQLNHEWHCKIISSQSHLQHGYN